MKCKPKNQAKHKLRLQRAKLYILCQRIQTQFELTSMLMQCETPAIRRATYNLLKPMLPPRLRGYDYDAEFAPRQSVESTIEHATEPQPNPEEIIT